jgi:hypothetical protein
VALPNTYVDLAAYSLAKGNGTTPPEIYIPLWWYSGAVVSTNTNQSTNLVGKGLTSLTSSSNKNLHTLNSNWSSTQKYAFEATLYASSGAICWAQLWDITSNAAVSASQISTSNTTATVIRSGQFTLTPGHIYGINLYTGNSANVYLTDASLIVFPS